VPVDVRALGCDFYAASGQKWLCGPNGTGYLYVRAERVPGMTPPFAGYQSLAAADRPLELELHPSARRLDTAVLASQDAAWALAALDTLEEPGIEAVQERAGALAARLAARLADHGYEVAPRGESTLVSWATEDPESTAMRLREQDVVVRYLPGTPYVRASVGAWIEEDEVERLAELASAGA
jgi:selenocysteine lyase/cysteine desulfurase